MSLSEKGFQAIKEDGELFGKIADLLHVSPFTLPDKIRKKDPAFTQADILTLIRETTGLTDKDLLEPVKPKSKHKSVTP